MVSTDQKTKGGERFSFSADIQQLMGIIVNSFYTKKEVFLRELISNSSDAIDKIRFKSLTNREVLGDETDFKIEIVGNREEKTLTIRDNGIGMTKDEMIKNLGTIAKSGTKAFMDAIKAGADIQMIGQFGVGFYSAFLVSNKVQVRSKSNEDNQYFWESTANGKFDIYDDSKNEHQLKRGTEVILHLKDDQLEYTEERRIKEIIKKHSEFVTPKINLWVSKEVVEKVPEEEEEPKVEEVKDDEEGKGEKEEEKKADDDVKIEEVKKDEDKPKMKEVTKVVYEWQQVNNTKPIWSFKQSEVKPEEYSSLYKTISNDWEEPLAYKHFRVEGQIEFTGILFLPKRAPFDHFNTQKEMRNIKLYVRKVFINDNAKDLCPDYLSFVKGVIDSEEMPLNISREILQQNNIMKIIRKNIVKKTLEMIEEVAEDKEKYDTFLKNFSKNIKYGVHEDSTNRLKLASFLRFPTTKSKKKEKTFKEYVEGMQTEQKDIYYITGESLDAIDKLPFLEKLNKKGLEVIYMTDPIDEYLVQQLTEFDGKKLVSVTKEGLELPDSEEEKKLFEQQKKDFEPFCKRVKEILGGKVEKVEVSNRMTDSPCYISTSRFGWSSRMEQIMRNQALRDSTFSKHMSAKKILEVNPSNPIIQKMSQRFIEDVNDPVSKNLVFLMYETALLTSAGFSLSDPMDFANRIFKLTRLGLNIEDDEADEDMPALEAVGDAKAEEREMEEVD